VNKINKVPSTQINVPNKQWCRCGNSLIKPAVTTNNLCLAYTCRTPWNYLVNVKKQNHLAFYITWKPP
jgi:hypothetical protein